MELNKELSYPDLCKIMGEKESRSGNVRKYQMERWQESYDIQKLKRGRYIIKAEYTPEQVQMIRAEKNYNNFVEATLLNFIAEGAITETYTYTKLRKGIAMINKHYSEYRSCLDKLALELPANSNIFDIDKIESEWFNIADRHDKYVLKRALERLRERGLIDYTESYVFQNSYLTKQGVVFTQPVQATDQQKAELEQVKVEFMKAHKMQSVQDIYKGGEYLIKQYYGAVNDKVQEFGYNHYARAFIILRPSELKKVVGYFAPKFNKAQVDRLLKSRRFKMIPPIVHEQMIDKTIKIIPQVFATTEELMNNNEGE